MPRLNHRLSANHLAELGTGYGSVACIKALLAGQRSLRLLQLRAIADADPQVRLALNLLAQTPSLARDVLFHPLVGVWAARRLRGATDDASYLTRLAATGPMRTVRMGDEHWHPSALIEDVDPYRDCFSFPPEPTLSDADRKRFGRAVEQAWAIVQSRHPAHAQAMKSSLRLLAPLRTERTSAASRLAFGAIGVGLTEDTELLAELFIHEFQHMKLGALLDMVRLHRDSGPAIHCAPWRSDPRPIGPLLQGTYAHLGVADYWRMRQRHTTDVQSRQAGVEFAYWVAQTGRAAATLAGSGELTEAGARFVNHLQETLTRWQGEADDLAAAEDLADCAVILWRMRNQAPQPGDVARLITAFRDGTPCPPVSPPATVPGTPHGPARPAPLAILMRQRLRDPASPLQGPPSDVDLLSGQTLKAISGYLERLRLDPDEPQAWAGLALALRRHGDAGTAAAVVARPDLARGVVRATGADPAHVARWLRPTATADRCRT